MWISNKANAFIWINPDADYAASRCVYQPESTEAIFNSLEKHTLWEDFQWRLYITQGTLSHDQYAKELWVMVWIMGEKVQGVTLSSTDELLISAKGGERRVQKLRIFH